MFFSLIDKIVSLEPEKSIVSTKSLSLSEEYLQDHFPKFPVMPGVLMLEAMTQSAAWLIRVSEDFAHSIVLLQEAKNVKYGRFLQPGETLVLSLEQTKQDENTTTFKAEGTVDGQSSLKAILTLARYNLRDANPDAPELRKADEDVIGVLRRHLPLIWKP